MIRQMSNKLIEIAELSLREETRVTTQDGRSLILGGYSEETAARIATALEDLGYDLEDLEAARALVEGETEQ